MGDQKSLATRKRLKIATTLGIVADWSFPLTKRDVSAVVQKFLDKQGKRVPIFKDNIPGDDFLNSFMTRNNLSIRIASNIKQSRVSVDQHNIISYFNNIREVLSDIDDENLYNYDEQYIQDDPGAKKAVVPRRAKRVEGVQNHTRTSMSLMVCGSANGDLLPPMVVYKAQNLYENWKIGKEQFPNLLSRLWNGISAAVGQNLISGFKATRLFPLNPQERIPGGIFDIDEAQIERQLDASVIELLQEHLRTGASRTKKEERQKDRNCKEISPPPQEMASNSGLSKPKSKEISPAEKRQTSKRSKNKTKDDSSCGICCVNWAYCKVGDEWIKCGKCHKWNCASCNAGSTDPFYNCVHCEDSSDEEIIDDSDADKVL
ncbi:hypothetical protein NQ314_002947 [Rhamnusium bicolor]|uniref:Uncharacterized protein n=1 Tax=Rhamnusium bicolor TaxID=1586634 RepID=A0AAV8ZPX0_9CUCU|nr:hypothetical protein NQ314_002947 [Rhamnusium bicolor]